MWECRYCKCKLNRDDIGEIVTELGEVRLILCHPCTEKRAAYLEDWRERVGLAESAAYGKPWEKLYKTRPSRLLKFE